MGAIPAAGEQLYHAGYSGALYPSAARPDHKALCLFRAGALLPGADPVRPPMTHRDPPAPPTDCAPELPRLAQLHRHPIAPSLAASVDPHEVHQHVEEPLGLIELGEMPGVLEDLQALLGTLLCASRPWETGISESFSPHTNISGMRAAR